MNTYKLRAECLADVTLFLQKVWIDIEKVTITSLGKGIPDVEMEFKTEMDFARIFRILAKIPDGHVMVETLALKRYYTGRKG